MTPKTSADNYQWTNLGNQYFATFAANLIIFSHGAIIGWVSPALPILSSENTTLASGPLTNEQVSWIGSINCIGALCGTLSLGYFITLLGCKRAMLILSMPCILFWLLIFFGDQYYHLLIARVASGYAGGGIQTSLILYVSEIANDNVRGRLGSSTQITRNFGILVGYVLGASVPYKFIPLISGMFPIVFTIIFLMLPNTPRFFFQRGKTQEAEEALKFYLGYKGESEQEDAAFFKEFERLKSITHENKTEEKLKLSDFSDPAVLKGLGIGIALTTFTQLTANFTITNYAVMIFSKAETTIDAYVSSILLAVCLILGAFFSTGLADILGRKILNIISLFGSAIGLSVVSLFHYLNRNGYDLSAFAFVPATSLSFVIFISAAGIMPLSMICSVEYLPPKVRTCGMAIICFSINVVTFICVKLFPILLDSALDLHGTLMIFATGSVIGAIFVIFVLEETSGACLDDVGLSEEEKMKRVHAARLNSI